MTREEAIEILRDTPIDIRSAREDDIHTLYATAQNMAIEALSREQKKYNAICDELVELKSDLNLPIEVVMAYEKSIGVVRKYAKMGDTE